MAVKAGAHPLEGADGTDRSADIEKISADLNAVQHAMDEWSRQIESHQNQRA